MAKRHKRTERQRRQMEQVWLAIMAAADANYEIVFKHGEKWHPCSINRYLEISPPNSCDIKFSTINDWARHVVAKKLGIPKGEVRISIRSRLRFYETDEEDVPTTPESEWLTVDQLLGLVDIEWAEVTLPSQFCSGNINICFFSQRYLVLYFNMSNRSDELSHDLRARVGDWMQRNPDFSSHHSLLQFCRRVWRP